MNIEVTPKQRLFLDATADEVLYGGAAGGGKSYVQLIDALVYASKYQGSKQLILRRTFPELERSLIRTALEMYPEEICSYNSSKHTFTFRNKSLIDFGYCDTDKDVIKYQSLEYDTIRFDELTHFSKYQYEYLGTRLRGANDYPKQRKSSTNPGGEGHTYFKERFIDPAPPNTLFTGPNGKTRIFLPARVQDNLFLMAKDPDYVKRLADLPDDQRKALLDGSWDLYEGQYFSEFSRDVHVARPIEIPPHWRVYFTMDYGLDMFAGYYIALDPQERGYVIREIYEPNMIISDAAKLILKTTKELGVKVHSYLAPTDLWNRRQETGKSVADIFYAEGLRLTKTSRDRIDGWMAMKEWLAPFEDEQGIRIAKLRFFPSCVNAIRCIPALQFSESKPNDVATKPHDITHAPDAIRGFCIHRSRPNRKMPVEDEERRLERAEENSFVSSQLYDVYDKGGEDFEQFDASDLWN
jgi:phage terminase large subunit